MCVCTSVLCVSFPLSSIVLSVCLDLNRSCVISTSELSVKFSYACRKEEKQNPFFVCLFLQGHVRTFLAMTSFIRQVTGIHFGVNAQMSK